jgi:hypothetical protein
LFGYHRGSFRNARVFILADPQGLDDWNTSRAMTGARGQYLHGLMEDLGVGADYLVLKTVPVGMDGATPDEWEVVRNRTEKYREAAIGKALENRKLEFLLADGPIAQAELARVLQKLGRSDIAVINLNRGPEMNSGIAEAGQKIAQQLPQFSGREVRGQMADIPRAHLPWWARTWEGTSGDRVIEAEGAQKGAARLLVTPNWVVEQKVNVSERVERSIADLRSIAEDSGIRLDHEDIQSFLRRRNLGDATLVRHDPCEELLKKR